MKLISCHIENFGKLHDLSIEFSKGYNNFCHENGWGKSTFAAFLRAMFYGFEGEGKKKVVDNERKRYKPWQGGTYGGSITFETQSKTYLLTRVFAEKSANDIFDLRDATTNIQSNDFSNNIGEELFLINSESFRRTVFISQNDCKTATTDNINAKIGNLTDNTDDLNNFESADKKLVSLLNHLTPDRKTGLIHKLKDEITSLKAEVSANSKNNENILALQNEISHNKDELSKLKIKQTELSKKQEDVSIYQNFKSQKEVYNLLCNECAEKEQKYKTARGLFGDKVPETSDLKHYDNRCADMNNALTSASIYKLSEDESSKLQSLKVTFENVDFEESELKNVFEDCKKLDSIMRYIASEKLTLEESETLKKYSKLFENSNNPKADVAEMISKWNQKSNLKSALLMKKAAANTLISTTSASKGKGMSALTIIGIIAIICGIILCTQILKIGIAVSVIGTLLLVIGLIFAKGNNNTDDSHIKQLQDDILKDESKILEYENTVKDFLVEKGIEFEEELVSETLQKLLEVAIDYTRILEKQEKSVGIEQNPKIKDLSMQIKAFLQKFDIFVKETDYLESLNKLNADYKEFEELKSKDLNYQEKTTEYSKAKEEIEQFIKSLGFEPEVDLALQIRKIYEMQNDLTNAKSEFDKACDKKTEFEKSNDMSFVDAKEPEGDLLKLNEEYAKSNDRIEEIRELILNLENRLENLYDIADEININNEQIAEKEAELKEKTKYYNHILKTREFLTTAKESLTAKYIGPLQESFKEHFDTVCGDDSSKYHIDANINVTVDELGMQREVDFLSEGYKDMVGVCLRFALIDAMYKGEKPMIILDDPFVNLDDKRILSAKKLLAEISKKYQVIYLTCNENRI